MSSNYKDSIRLCAGNKVNKESINNIVDTVMADCSDIVGNLPKVNRESLYNITSEYVYQRLIGGSTKMDSFDIDMLFKVSCCSESVDVYKEVLNNVIEKSVR